MTVACSAVAALTACSSEPPAVAGVVATTSIWADIASEVLCRDVPALIPLGADPHSFEPSLRDREAVERARLVVANGAGLDGNLSDMLGSTSQVVEVSRAVDLVDDDPHIWQDPERVARAAAAIARAAGDDGDPDCADAYAERLDRLDRDIVEILAPIPDDARVMVTSHDALSYFADRYGLEIVGTVIPSTNTLAETNAADLGALAVLIEERGVPAIFTESLESSDDADALADRLGVRVVPLVTDSLTDDADADTYLEMMRSNAERIAEALTP